MLYCAYYIVTCASTTVLILYKLGTSNKKNMLFAYLEFYVKFRYTTHAALLHVVGSTIFEHQHQVEVS